MSEKIVERIKRIEANDKLVMADTEKGPGDLFIISKYIAEKMIMSVSAYGGTLNIESMEDSGLRRGGNKIYYHKDATNKPEIKNFLKIFYSDSYIKRYNLEMGQHTLAKAFGTKYVFSYPVFTGVGFTYKKEKKGVKNIPTVRYDVRTFFPDKMTDAKGDFIFTFKNFQDYEKMKQDDDRRIPYPIKATCRICGRSINLLNVKESQITSVVRGKDGQMFFKMVCTNNCGNAEVLMPIALTSNTPHYPTGFNYFISELQLSSKYCMRTRMNGSSITSKLYSYTGDNYTPFTLNNWGKILSHSIMEYADKRKLPVEVNKNAVAYR